MRESERLWERLSEAAGCEQNNISRFIPGLHLTLGDINAFIHTEVDTHTVRRVHSHKGNKENLMGHMTGSDVAERVI